MIANSKGYKHFQSQATGKCRRLITLGFSHGCFLLLVLAASCLNVAHARNLYQLTVTSNGQTATRGYSDIETFADQLSNNGLTNITPAYTDTSAALARLDVRGLPAIASYSANSTALNFNVPSLGINLDFNGVTRDDSKSQFFDFLKGNGSDILSQLLQGFVSQTAVDPVAGNPNSMVAKMAQDDFRAASTSDAGGEHNLFGTGLMAGHSQATGFQTNTVSVPINYIYTLPVSSKAPYLLILDIPLRYLNVEGADIYDGSVGLGATLPIIKTLSLTPMFRYGAVGSFNAGSIQAVYSGTLTSKFDYYLNDLKLSSNNMIGYYQTGTISSKYGGSYNLQNVIFRNGLSAEGSLNYKLFDEPTSWEVQFIDTRVAGDAWFINGYEEIVATVGTRRRTARMDWQTLRFGASLTLGKSFQGGQLLFSYRF
jgi:hypothetical protein